MTLTDEQRRHYREDGYVVVENLFAREEIDELNRRTDEILDVRTQALSGSQVIDQFGRSGAPVLRKIRGLVASEPAYRRIATDSRVADVLEALLDEEAVIFRDVLIVKSAHEGAEFHWHQDSAYWDVDPPALVSAWIPLGDVPESAGPLRVIPGTQHAVVEHDIFVSDTRKLPMPVTRLLRRLVSLAGTGDNPDATSGSALSKALDRAKVAILGRATKFVPALAHMSELQIDPKRAEELGREVVLPVSAGSVVFFHSLLLHASSPNRSPDDRRAAIISYMGRSARYTGRGDGAFLSARASA